MCAPDDGWRHDPKHVEPFPDINKLRNVASCWKYMKRNMNIRLWITRCRRKDSIKMNITVAESGDRR